MKRNQQKRETDKDYTSWDLNCRRYIPHDKALNKLEKIFKRGKNKGRRGSKRRRKNRKEKIVEKLNRDLTNS